MSAFEAELTERLDSLRLQNLHRQLRPVSTPQSPCITMRGDTLLNFSSNDYLGLANHPALKKAAIEAIERFGAGSCASRLISGSLALHHELEEDLAVFKGTPAALSFSSGYAAALGTICALLDKEDVIVIDKLVHACIVDAARLSGAKLRVFAHNDLDELKDILQWARDKSQNARAHSEADRSAIRQPQRRVLIVTESVFSMDGDFAPLNEIVELKEKYGAWLMLDEAHGTGLYGANGRGRADEAGASGRIEIQMGTLGKALGASGGFICGPRSLIDYLLNRARTFVFSTAPVPAAVAAAAAGVRLAQSADGNARRKALWQRVQELRSRLGAPRHDSAPPSAIIPIMIGDEGRAVQTASELRARGIYAPAVRYPTVARGQARLRVTLTAAHSEEQVSRLAVLLKDMHLRI